MLHKFTRTMDHRFHFGHCIRIAGPSQCGKTSTLLKLLESKSYFFPCPPKRIMWVSGSGVCNHKLTSKILSCYPASQLFYTLPQDLDEQVREFDFWVFDDLSSELRKNSSFTNFFTKTAHHKNCIMAYLTQNAYEQGPDATTRTRNCAYQIYFNNKADVRWIRVLGDQLLGNHRQFASLFHKATAEPYSCLLVDNRATTPNTEQFIGNPFFPTEQNPTCFLVVNK